MYATAGALVAKVSGIPWDIFVETRIFEPLGTDGTTLHLLDAQPNALFRPQMFVDADEFYPTQRLTEPRWMTHGFGGSQHDYEGRWNAADRRRRFSPQREMAP